MLIVSQVLCMGPVGSREREKYRVLCGDDDDLGFGVVVTSKDTFLPTWSGAARVSGSQPGASEFIQELGQRSETKVEQSLRKFCLTLT